MLLSRLPAAGITGVVLSPAGIYQGQLDAPMLSTKMLPVMVCLPGWPNA